MYQEVNNLRILDAGLTDRPLTLTQRDQVIALLESSASKTFGKIRTALKISNEFNLEDAKRTLLKGNATAAILSDAMHFGDQWHAFSSESQDEITLQLIDEENEETLIAWLIDRTSIDSEKAERIANVTLPQGYGKLSAKALAKILPALQKDVITYDAAVIAGGFAHHSNLNPSINGEPLPYLPYYGIPLTRHVNFGSGKESDPEEKRFGKIANPTVHVGLNQIRTVINALIKRYGHPQEVVVELARELKRSREQKLEDMRIQAENQKRNERFRADAAQVLGISPEAVSRRDIQKLILWSELNLSNAAERRCPYSGQQISVHMLLSEVVEIEHILPYSTTLDDTLNNKTVAMREANRIKGNRTPWEAKNDFEAKGWSFEGIQARALLMNKHKRYRFSENAMQIWDKEDKGFLARALNDTRYLSRVAKEYISLICPNNTRVIPGKMTAMLRGTFGLNRILSKGGEKNRNDHRHHAVDACVIGITDQNLLTRFSNASANARKNSLNRLITSIEPPWSNFLPHVQRAIDAIHVSHKPDHGFEGPIMEATAYGIKKDGSIRQKRNAEGESGREITNLIRIREPHQKERHGCDSNGNSLPYKGYIGGSNYCIEITEDEDGEWIGDVVTTYQAYRIAAPRGHVLPNGLALLRNPKKGLNGKKLVMRLVINDTVRMKVNDEFKYMRFTKVSASNGQMTFAPINEANADQRNRDKDDPFKFVTKYASSLKKAKASFVTISPIGKIRIR